MLYYIHHLFTCTLRVVLPGGMLISQLQWVCTQAICCVACQSVSAQPGGVGVTARPIGRRQLGPSRAPVVFADTTIGIHDGQYRAAAKPPRRQSPAAQRACKAASPAEPARLLSSCAAV